MEKPITIRIFDQVFPATLAIQMVLFWLVMEDLTRLLDQNPAVSGSGLTAVFIYGQVFFSLLGWLLLWHFISRRGSNVARWILTVMIVQSSLATLYDPSVIMTKTGPHIAVYAVNFVLTLAANLCLFLPASNEWFAEKAVVR
jgi:hypothetical protein